MGKWFLTDNSATVGRILRIFLADSHEISILMKLWKISPLKCLRGRGRKLRITGIGIWANFGLILFKFSVFRRAFFFLWGHHHETLTLRVQSAMLGEHFSQKLTLAHPYNPIFWPEINKGRTWDTYTYNVIYFWKDDEKGFWIWYASGMVVESTDTNTNT